MLEKKFPQFFALDLNFRDMLGFKMTFEYIFNCDILVLGLFVPGLDPGNL